MGGPSRIQQLNEIITQHTFHKGEEYMRLGFSKCIWYIFGGDFYFYL